jgi:type II secretory pathway predicted ATPase ExeA
MNPKKLLSLYGLKWDPFSPDLPSEAIIKTPRFDQFCWRVETLTLEGGFALISGDSGLGKSVNLRALSDHLVKIREITVGELSRPQSGIADFYRELGHLFGIELKVSNRYGGYRALREKWKSHVDSTLLRPVLLIDEAQEMQPAVLSELRLLVSSQFDSQLLLTVVFAGDNRLNNQLRTPELVPLGTRMRTRLNLEPLTKQDLLSMLRECTHRAGNSNIMTEELQSTIAEHSAGNPRIMMALAGEILSLAMQKELRVLDESLYFLIYGGPSRPGGRLASKKHASEARQ